MKQFPLCSAQCGNHLMDGQAMCHVCWSGVPTDLRAAIKAAKKDKKSSAYLNAVQAAKDKVYWARRDQIEAEQYIADYYVPGKDDFSPGRR